MWLGVSGRSYLFNSFHTGAKEINLAASVEHFRDHRPHMVKTKVCMSIVGRPGFRTNQWMGHFVLS